MRGLDSTAGVVALAALVLAVVGLLLCAWLALRLRRLRADQMLVIGEHRGDIVAHCAELTRSVERISVELDTRSQALASRLDEAERRLDGSVSRTAVLRYDALNESTGRQSSSIAMLDELGNGVVVSSILQREQARVYAKPIVAGRSQLRLSPEEREAIASAVKGVGAERGSDG